MNVLSWLRRAPLVLKVPVFVAGLMIVISAVISERVLSRLYDSQQENLKAIVETYLDGLATTLTPPVLRDDIWDAYDILDRTPPIYGALAPIETVVTGRDGRVLASSNPKSVPVLSSLPADYRSGNVIASGLEIDWTSTIGYAERAIEYQGRTVGAIHASFDTAHLVAERRDVLHTLLVTNSALALIFAAIGYALVRRMVQPVKTLADHMQSGARGTPQTIAENEFPQKEGEFADLFEGFNALVEAERERVSLTKRLAEEDKLSSLGRLASSMAHEINNPLGGLFNSIDTLRRHGSDASIRDSTLALLERGLAGIRDVVRAALATYRPERSIRPLQLQDLDDIRVLVEPEISRRRQTLDWERCPVTAHCGTLPAAGVRQALLNLVLNASTASGDGGRVAVKMRLEGSGETLVLSVSDTGPGLPENARRILMAHEAVATAPGGGGLGLWMVRQMIDESGGRLAVVTSDKTGTCIEIHLPYRQDLERTHAA